MTQSLESLLVGSRLVKVENSPELIPNIIDGVFNDLREYETGEHLIYDNLKNAFSRGSLIFLERDEIPLGYISTTQYDSLNDYLENEKREGETLVLASYLPEEYLKIIGINSIDSFLPGKSNENPNPRYHVDTINKILQGLGEDSGKRALGMLGKDYFVGKRLYYPEFQDFNVQEPIDLFHSNDFTEEVAGYKTSYKNLLTKEVETSLNTIIYGKTFLRGQ